MTNEKIFSFTALRNNQAHNSSSISDIRNDIKSVITGGEWLAKEE